jgi:hypothetical protein
MTARAARRRRAFAALEADPRFDPFRRRRGRRRLLAAHLAWGAAGYAAAGLATVSVLRPVAVAVALVVWLAGFVVLTGWLNGSVGGVTELPYAVLDEAQASVRRRAESDAHRTVRAVLFLVGLAAVGTLGSTYGAMSAGKDPSWSSALALGVTDVRWTWSLIAVAATCSVLAILPLYLLAWRLPDDVVEPEPVEPAA